MGEELHVLSLRLAAALCDRTVVQPVGKVIDFDVVEVCRRGLVCAGGGFLPDAPDFM
jgi:hypothetical protein